MTGASCKKCGCGTEDCRCTHGTCGCGKKACSCGVTTGEIHVIDAETLKNKMAAQPDMLIVNVLASDYYDDCHITGSINVPLETLKEKAAEWKKDRKIIVYCARHECTASKEAAQLLAKLGFTNVCCYEGGTKEWRKKGLSCEGTCALDYLS